MNWVTDIVLAELAISLILVFIRLMLGPSLPDRVVALDMIAILSAAIIAIYTIKVEEPVYLDVAITLTLVAFLGTIAFARYIQKTGEKKMPHLFSSILMIIGATFMLISAIGVLRMPDLMMRMHSSTKAATFGIVLIFFSVAAYFSHLDITTRCLAAVVFLFLTAPVGTHMIAKSAYLIGVPLWKNTQIDDLKSFQAASEE